MLKYVYPVNRLCFGMHSGMHACDLVLKCQWVAYQNRAWT